MYTNFRKGNDDIEDREKAVKITKTRIIRSRNNNKDTSDKKKTTKKKAQPSTTKTGLKPRPYLKSSDSIAKDKTDDRIEKYDVNSDRGLETEDIHTGQ